MNGSLPAAVMPPEAIACINGFPPLADIWVSNFIFSNPSKKGTDSLSQNLTSACRTNPGRRNPWLWNLTGVWNELRKEITENYVIRKANEVELKYYWSTIAFDIEEPLFILETQKHNYILNLSKNELKAGIFYLFFFYCQK